MDLNINLSGVLPQSNINETIQKEQIYKNENVTVEYIKEINGFKFSKGLIDLSLADNKSLNIIATAMKSFQDQHLKKYQMKQEIFYQRIPCSDSFIDFYYSELNGDIEDCDAIIEEHYSGFEYTTKDDVINKINESLYLKDKEKLRNQIIENILDINGLEAIPETKKISELKQDIASEQITERFISQNWEKTFNEAPIEQKEEWPVQINPEYKKTHALIQNILANECIYFFSEKEMNEYVSYLTVKAHDFILRDSEPSVDKIQSLFSAELIQPDFYQDYNYVKSYATYNWDNNIYRGIISSLFKFNQGFACTDEKVAHIFERVCNEKWTNNDTKIVKYLNRRYTNSDLAIVRFYSIYYAENGVLEYLKRELPDFYFRFDPPDTNLVFDMLMPMLKILRAKENIIGGVSVKKNKFTGNLFIDTEEDFNNRNLYIPYEERGSFIENEALSDLLKLKELIGKTPNISELDTPVTTPENAIEVIDLAYTMPKSNFYKEKYGSIAKAIKAKQ